MESSHREQFSLFVNDEGKIIRSTRNQKNQKKRENLWMYIGFVGDLGLTIITPIAIGGFLGAFIDREVNSYPTYTRWLLVAGFFISIVGFVQIIKEITRRKN